MHTASKEILIDLGPKKYNFLTGISLDFAQWTFRSIIVAKIYVNPTVGSHTKYMTSHEPIHSPGILYGGFAASDRTSDQPQSTSRGIGRAPGMHVRPHTRPLGCPGPE